MNRLEENDGGGAGLEVLEADLAELQNSVSHLVRSNVELAQFLQESPGDADLEQALEENKTVLVRKRQRIKTLKNAISDLKAYRPHLHTPSNPSTLDSRGSGSSSTSSGVVLGTGVRGTATDTSGGGYRNAEMGDQARNASSNDTRPLSTSLAWGARRVPEGASSLEGPPAPPSSSTRASAPDAPARDGYAPIGEPPTNEDEGSEGVAGQGIVEGVLL